MNRQHLVVLGGGGGGVYFEQLTTRTDEYTFIYLIQARYGLREAGTLLHILQMRKWRHKESS